MVSEALCHLTMCNSTSILTAGPGGPAEPVSPSFPGRPCSERSVYVMKSGLEMKHYEFICEVFMANMYSLSDQDDPQVPSLLTFQVHPVTEEILYSFSVQQA